jgi:hypothetical protein
VLKCPRSFGVTLSIALVATCAAAQPVVHRAAPRGTYAIPAAGTTVALLPSTRPVIHAIVNGHGPFRMLVETGSLISYLLPAAYTTTFGNDSARSTDKVTIGDATLTGITIRRNAQLGVPGIDGLLGLDALYDAAITIDFPASQLHFSRDTLPAANGRDVLQMGVATLFWTVPLTLGDKPVNAIIDTQSGLSISSIPARAESLAFTTTPVAVGRARGPTIGNVIVHRARLAASAHLGDAELQQPLIDMLPLAPQLPQDAFILGLQVLTNFAVTLDQRVGRARFARADRVVPAPPPAYATGMGSTQQPDGLRVVLSVLESSAAAEAGIRPGDVILRVDGRATSDMNDVAWTNAVGGRVPLQLRLRRNSVELDVTLIPRYLGF